MSLAAEILVIILSIFLALFLILGITLLVYLIKLTREMRTLTNSAGKAVTNIGAAIAGVTKLTSPLFVAEMVGRYFRKFTTNKKGRK